MAATKDMQTDVILVNDADHEIGRAEKLAAHQQGLLHRAFSIFIFRRNPEFELLLQQRASTKYHSPLLWTNTCCSHPSPGETILQAAKRRLREEFNLVVPHLQDVAQFHYIAHFNNGLIENELDHVVLGLYTQESKLTPNPQEVQAYRWVQLSDLKEEILKKPEQFTPWFEKALTLAQKNLP